MRKLLLGIFAVLFTQFAIAEGNATPFGVEVGVAKLADVQREVGSKIKLEPSGTNDYSGGKMFKAEAAGLGIDGVNEITFIFDQNNVLAAAIVTMDKDPRALAKTFTGKYKTVSNRIDGFMNYGYAKFQKGDTIIEIDAPHLSFQMEVRYVTKALMAAYTQKSSSELADKKKHKANSL